jgi:hypothetical protein
MSYEAIRQRLADKPYLWAYIIGTALLLLCSVLWWFTVFIGPKHVFWSMIRNSLSTDSVVYQTKQTQGNDSLEQLVHVDTAHARAAHALTTLKQGKTTVKTEVIGTKTADYTRYVDITSDAKADTSKLKNVWAKSDDTRQSETQASGHQLYAQATLGIGLPLGSTPVPVGKLSGSQRKVLYDYIRNQAVYSPDFGKVKKERKDGRLLYTYNVKLQTILYIGMMKQFARDLGLPELDATDPNSFQSTPTLTVSVTVDALSHQLASVNFEQGYKQEYKSYGLPLKMEIPQKTITNAELQKRLGAVGQVRQ